MSLGRWSLREYPRACAYCGAALVAPRPGRDGDRVAMIVVEHPLTRRKVSVGWHIGEEGAATGGHCYDVDASADRLVVEDDGPGLTFTMIREIAGRGPNRVRVLHEGETAVDARGRLMAPDGAALTRAII